MNEESDFLICWHGGGADRVVRTLLDRFVEANQGCSVVEEEPKKTHAWGSGGEQEFLYSLLGSGGEQLLTVLLQNSYTTTSDDSEDYAYPTRVRLSFLPYMSELVNAIAEQLKREFPSPY